MSKQRSATFCGELASPPRYHADHHSAYQISCLRIQQDTAATLLESAPTQHADPSFRCVKLPALRTQVPKAPWSALAPATAVRSHPTAAASLPHSKALCAFSYFLDAASGVSNWLEIGRSVSLVTVLMPRSFGLTGGIASGKSTVARILEELGAKVIDADRVGHELLRRSNPVHHQVVARFGQEILRPDGEIDRGRLGSIVFADAEKLRELSAIVHPTLIARVDGLAAALRAGHPGAVILVDAAVIYEAGAADRFRKILVAWCRPEQQIERLVAKTGLSREDAIRRVASQIPSEAKRRRADYVVDCSGSLAETRAQAEALYPELKRLAEAEDGNWKMETGK